MVFIFIIFINIKLICKILKIGIKSWEVNWNRYYVIYICMIILFFCLGGLGRNFVNGNSFIGLMKN